MDENPVLTLGIPGIPSGETHSIRIEWAKSEIRRALLLKRNNGLRRVLNELKYDPLKTDERSGQNSFHLVSQFDNHLLALRWTEVMLELVFDKIGTDVHLLREQLNRRDLEDQTPLSLALRRSHESVARLLLSWGAEPRELSHSLLLDLVQKCPRALPSLLDRAIVGVAEVERVVNPKKNSTSQKSLDKSESTQVTLDEEEPPEENNNKVGQKNPTESCILVNIGGLVGGSSEVENQEETFYLRRVPSWGDSDLWGHPISAAFLHLKWRKYRFLFYPSIFLHLTWIALYFLLVYFVYGSRCFRPGSKTYRLPATCPIDSQGSWVTFLTLLSSFLFALKEIYFLFGVQKNMGYFSRDLRIYPGWGFALICVLVAWPGLNSRILPWQPPLAYWGSLWGIAYLLVQISRIPGPPNLWLRALSRVGIKLGGIFALFGGFLLIHRSAIGRGFAGFPMGAFLKGNWGIPQFLTLSGAALGSFLMGISMREMLEIGNGKGSEICRRKLSEIVGLERFIFSGRIKGGLLKVGWLEFMEKWLLLGKVIREEHGGKVIEVRGSQLSKKLYRELMDLYHMREFRIAEGGSGSSQSGNGSGGTLQTKIPQWKSNNGSIGSNRSGSNRFGTVHSRKEVNYRIP